MLHTYAILARHSCFTIGISEIQNNNIAYIKLLIVYNVKKLLITCITNYQIPLKLGVNSTCGLALFPYPTITPHPPCSSAWSLATPPQLGFRPHCTPSTVRPMVPTLLLQTLPPYPSIQYHLPIRWNILFELSLFGAFTETTYYITSYITAAFCKWFVFRR